MLIETLKKVIRNYFFKWHIPKKDVAFRTHSSRVKKKNDNLADSLSTVLADIAVIIVFVYLVQYIIRDDDKVSPPPFSKDFIIAEIKVEGEVHLGFSVRHENKEFTFIKAQPDAAVMNGLHKGLDYSNGYKKCNASECKETVARLVIQQPVTGTWKIEPFLYQDRNIKGELKLSNLANPVYHYWTRTQSFENVQDENECINQPTIMQSEGGVQFCKVDIEIK